MTNGQKTAVSLLVSIIFIAAFTIAAFAGLFSVIETRFYQPAVINTVEERLSQISRLLNEYNQSHITRFRMFAESRGMLNCFETEQDATDIQQRTDLAAMILTETVGLRGIRLVDANGRRIHFSTFEDDILRTGNDILSYNSYTSRMELPYSLVHAPEDEDYRLFFDKANNRLVYAFPAFDHWKAYRGSLLFYVEASDFARFLTAQKIISITDFPAIAASITSQDAVQNPHARGFIFGMPSSTRSILASRDILVAELEKKWNTSLYGVERLASIEDSVWVSISNTESPFACVSWVYPEDFFVFSVPIRITLLACVFITIYLIIFLVFNLRRDPMLEIRDKIRRFQISFIQNYFETKESVEWNKLASEIALRKHEVSQDIRRSIGKQAARHKEEVDLLLERNWDEILNVIGKKPEAPAVSTQASTDELKTMLEQILSSGAITVNTVAAPRSPEKQKTYAEAPIATEVEELDSDVEEIPGLDDAPPVKEINVEEVRKELQAKEEHVVRVIPRATDIHEELRFGVPEAKAEDSKELDVNFEVFAQDFSFLDAIDEFDDDEIPVTDGLAQAESKEPQELVPLQSQDIMLYSIFGQQGVKTQKAETLDASESEATSDVIIENDGMYSIPNDVSISAHEQDPEFKDLVDSVLH